MEGLILVEELLVLVEEFVLVEYQVMSWNVEQQLVQWKHSVFHHNQDYWDVQVLEACLELQQVNIAGLYLRCITSNFELRSMEYGENK